MSTTYKQAREIAAQRLTDLGWTIETRFPNGAPFEWADPDTGKVGVPTYLPDLVADPNGEAIRAVGIRFRDSANGIDVIDELFSI